MAIPSVTSNLVSQAASLQTNAAAPSGAGALSQSKSGSGSVPFAELMRSMVDQTDQQQATVQNDLKDMVSGEATSIHDIVLNASRADLAFRLVMEIRNRLISSYQEIMRMQV